MRSDDPVHAQYEALPYPPRDPADEAKRLVTGSPSHLAEIVHYVRGGYLDPAQRFRALIAGGGTGDAAIMLAQQLAEFGARDAEIIYLDWSTASRRIAEARARARGLTTLRFVTGSLLDLAALGLGGFDYIDCCGVLHHLEDPEAGLAALTNALAPEGGMGLMLYAPLGRIGVYPMQAALRALDTDETPAQRVAFAKRVLDQLPPTNWLKRNPFMTDHLVEGDAGLHDLLLHARDRAYATDEVHDLVARARLRLVSFVPAARYAPRSYLSDGAVLKRADALDARGQAALAEALAGNIKSHAFYVVHAGNAVTAPAPVSLELIPVPANIDPAQLAEGLRGNDVLTATVDGLPFRMPLPRLAPAILRRVDGTRSLRAIHAQLVTQDQRLGEDAFLAQFAKLFASLNGLGKMMLRHPS